MGVVKNFDHNFGDFTISDQSNGSGVNLASYNNTLLESDMLINPSCQYGGDSYSISFPSGDHCIANNMIHSGGPFFECSNRLFCNIIWYCFTPERHSGNNGSECFVTPGVCQDSASAFMNGGLLAIQSYGTILMIMAFWWY